MLHDHDEDNQSYRLPRERIFVEQSCWEERDNCFQLSPLEMHLLALSADEKYMTAGHNMSRLMTKPTKWHMHLAKTQISLGIRPVWSESWLCAQWVAKDPSFLHTDSEDSDRTGRMLGTHGVLLVLSWGGSYMESFTYTKRLSPVNVCIT